VHSKPRLAASIEVNFKYLQKLGLDMCLEVEALAPELAASVGRNGGGASTLDQISRVIAQRIDLLRAGLGG